MRYKDFMLMQKEFCPPDPDSDELKHEIKRLRAENRTLKKQLNFYVQAYFSLQEKLYKQKIKRG